MYDSVLPSDPITSPLAVVPATVRGDSTVRATFMARQGATSIGDLYQRGALRFRFPRTGRCEAVVVNTGGGITGGDRIAMSVALSADSQVTLTSQAAEKIYRSDGPPARLAIEIKVSSGASLDWVPQETILYDHAAMDRALNVDVAADARLTMLEMVVFGRAQSGEVVTEGSWRDTWSIRRAGTLVFSDRVRLQGNIDDILRRPAVTAGACAIATLIHVASDAEARLPDIRDAIAGREPLCAASAWNGVLVVRFIAASAQELREAASAVVTRLTGTAMPRSWSC